MFCYDLNSELGTKFWDIYVLAFWFSTKIPQKKQQQQ